MSERLTRRVSRRFRKVIATFETRREKDHAGYFPVYGEAATEEYWRTENFTGIESYLHLCFDDNWAFINDIFAGNCGGFDIQELEVVNKTNDHNNDERLLINRKSAESQVESSWSDWMGSCIVQ